MEVSLVERRVNFPTWLIGLSRSLWCIKPLTLLLSITLPYHPHPSPLLSLVLTLSHLSLDYLVYESVPRPCHIPYPRSKSPLYMLPAGYSIYSLIHVALLSLLSFSSNLDNLLSPAWKHKLPSIIQHILEPEIPDSYSILYTLDQQSALHLPLHRTVSYPPK